MSRLLYFISLFNILTNHLTFVDKFYETKDFTKKKKIYIFLQDIFYYNRTKWKIEQNRYERYNKLDFLR